MGVQVIEHHVNSFRLGEAGDQVLHGVRKIDLGSTFGDQHLGLAAFGLAYHHQVADRRCVSIPRPSAPARRVPREWAYEPHQASASDFCQSRRRENLDRKALHRDQAHLPSARRNPRRPRGYTIPAVARVSECFFKAAGQPHG